jgi:hypothetical protein
MSPEPGPRQVAENEAARQSVALAFGIAGVIVVLLLQKKYGPLQAMLAHADPSAESLRRMESAQAAKRRWSRVADWLWSVRLPGWRTALAKAESAHQAYERERP